MEIILRNYINRSEISFEFGGGIVGYDAKIIAFKKKTLQNIQ